MMNDIDTAIAKEQDAAEQRRITQARREYAKALGGAMTGDTKAVKALAKVCEKHGIAPADAKADIENLKRAQAARETIESWTSEDAAELESRNGKIRALNEYNKKWPAEYQRRLGELKQERQPWLSKKQRVDAARKQLEALEKDAHFQAIEKHAASATKGGDEA